MSRPYEHLTEWHSWPKAVIRYHMPDAPLLARCKCRIDATVVQSADTDGLTWPKLWIKDGYLFARIACPYCGERDHSVKKLRRGGRASKSIDRRP